jgi:hypothetical protein
LFKTKGYYDNAEPFYLRSLEIFEKNLGPDHQDTVTCRNSLESLLQLKTNQRPELKTYRESLVLAERLASADPTNSEWQQNLSVSQEKVGDLLRAPGDLNGALQAYRESISLRKRLAAADPTNASWQRDLSVSYNKVGDVLSAQGELAGALKAYRESLAIIERLAAADPTNASWQRDLSVSYNKVGDVLSAQGDLAGARPSCSDSGMPTMPTRSFEIEDSAMCYKINNFKPVPSTSIENLRFSAFYPERISSQHIGKILVYAHLESVTRVVTQEAARILNLTVDTKMKVGSEKTNKSLHWKSVVRVTPDIPGLIFDKDEEKLSLWDDNQSVVFRFQCKPTEKGKVCNGWVHFWIEGILLADVAVNIYVADENVPDIFREALTEANARPYRYVFPSYSHQDGYIVEQLEAYAESFGDKYLRDIHNLRSGERWNDKLAGFIKQADVFQLFWSDNSAKSTYVEHEWRHALLQRDSRSDPYFVRPVYWSKKPASPIPQDLQDIHFARIPYLTRLKDRSGLDRPG